MDTTEAATHHDYLKENAGNIWFVLGAYFLAFFPWAVMSNIDFISEKWRPCRRTRRLGYTHLALSVFPIIYVALYAEAQRRDEDNKELGAALAALTFNVFQLMRTIMGLVQLNAFVAWCKHGVECIKALQGAHYLGSEKRKGARREETRTKIGIVREWQKVLVLWCKRRLQRMHICLSRDGGNGEQRGNEFEQQNIELSVNVNEIGNDVDGTENYMDTQRGLNGEERNRDPEADSNARMGELPVECNCKSSERVNELTVNPLSSKQRNGQETKTNLETQQEIASVSWCRCASERTDRRKADDGTDIEDAVMVNNIVVDNELGGRDVTVIPSFEKIWKGLKKGEFKPSKWLRTDRVILNTVRWSGAYLCGMGADWSAHTKDFPFDFRDGAEILKSFFSREMEDMRRILQQVEWDMKIGNDSSDFLSIYRLGRTGEVELTGEMSTAFGNRDTSYDPSDTFTVDAYSFEFMSLVSSYPTVDKDIRRSTNRERIAVGLVHSVLLAKLLGIGNLKAIRRYYDRYRLPDGSILRNAFKLLHRQRSAGIPDDARIWEIFESNGYQIPIFPYRMQMVALWDEATNWRVLQASAHQDIFNSSVNAFSLKYFNKNQKRILRNVQHPVNIFNYCTNWVIEQIGKEHLGWKGSLGVVMETVRSFLAEWITECGLEPNWEPEIPATRVEFNTRETTIDDKYLTWICQRELQRKVAKVSSKEQNLPGNAALIMLFILGFPLLYTDHVQCGGVGANLSQDEVQNSNASSGSTTHRSIDLNVHTWHTWSPIAPQDISLIIQSDSDSGTVSMRLRNESSNMRFIWQDWVDATMGCMKGFEKSENCEWGYRRRIVQPNLLKPIVELSPLSVNGHGIEAVVERTSTARVWAGWPVFDVRICKFEVDQWVNACNIDIRNWRETQEIECFEGIIQAIVSTVKEEVEASK